MHPTTMEIKEIYDLWKQSFSFDDGGWIDDYFKYNFNSADCFVQRNDKNIVATLCAHPHQMQIDGKLIPVVFIIGVITKQEFRHQGYMKKLFDQVYAHYNDTCSLYILQAYHPVIYEPLGFKMQYYTYEYAVTNVYKGIDKAVPVSNPSDLLAVSESFLAHYDGYLTRDLSYYENYLRQTSAQDALLYGIYQEDILQGFYLAYQDDTCLHIDEMMYRNEEIRNQLIAYAQESFAQVILVSNLPLKQYKEIKKHGNLMVKIANKTILKNILQKEISSIEDVYQDLTKPLYHYDFW